MGQQRNRHQIGYVVGCVGALITLSATLMGSAQVDAQAVFATNTPTSEPAVIASATGQPLPTQNPANPALFATNTPSGADDTGDPLFATNTPAAAPPTQTPRPQPNVIQPNTPIPTATPVQRPQADAFNYALRLWVEAPLVDVVFRQVQALEQNQPEAERALQLTLHELDQRFPGAPTDPAQRADLIAAMLAAPRGTVDMRSIVRPFIEDAINARPGQTTFTVNGFSVTLQRARFDTASPADAIVRVVYPEAAADGSTSPLYEEYVPALVDDSGTRLLSTAYDLPAVPFGGVQRVSLIRLQDVNRDGLDEAVLLVDDGQVNERLLIVAARSGEAVDLTAPGEEIRFGQLVEWDVDNPANDSPVLSVLNYRQESALPDFPCTSELPVEWEYTNNLYRPTVAPNADYEFQATLGCEMLAAEPFFAEEPAQAIGRLQAILDRYPLDAPGSERAFMIQAMLHVLNNQPDAARNIAQSLLPVGQDPTETWIGQQADAMLAGLGISGNTPLNICESLLRASEAGACDIDGVLSRLFDLVELTTDTDLIGQLRGFGLPVLRDLRVSELGRAERIAVQFDLAGSGWWAFAPQRDGTYQAEQSEPPVDDPVIADRFAVLEAPESAYTALLVDNDPIGTLNILDTLARNNPDVPLSPAAQYLQALSHDLTGDRAAARQGYYTVWNDFPATIWGELASAHLELR